MSSRATDLVQTHILLSSSLLEALSCLSVCLSVNKIIQKLVNDFFTKFGVQLWYGHGMNQLDLVTDWDTGPGYRIISERLGVLDIK